MSSAPDHSEAFKRRRLMNWLPLGLTLAAFYLGRYNLIVASTEIMTRFGLSKAQFGTIATAGFWTYALAVMCNGPLTDRFGGRRAILIAAAGTAAVNLAIGMLFLSGWQTKVVVGMSLLYAVNQYFQSFGALSVVKVNSAWFHVRERGGFGGIFGVMISAGYFLAMTLGGWILSHMSWYMVFLVPSGAVALMMAVDYRLVADTPASAGQADFDTGDASSRDADKDKPVDMAYLTARVFKNKVILALAAAEFCSGFVRQGLLLWFVPFLKEVHGVKHGMGLFTMATAGITIGAVVGSLACGYLSDKVFQSRRPPVAFICYLGQIASLFALGHAKDPAAASFLIGFSCMWSFGAQGLLWGTASMDFGGTKAAATVTGLLEGVGYAASGLTGVFLGSILDNHGWGVWTYMIMPFSAMGAILMAALWNATPLDAKAGLEG